MSDYEFVPLPKQYLTMTSPAREVFFAGAAGPGKSELLIQILKRRAILAPGSNHVYFRRVTKDLDAHVDDALKAIPTQRDQAAGIQKIADFRADKNVFTFLNGSKITFSHLQLEQHKENHRGPEYDTICFDEASLFTESQINFLKTRLRSTIRETYERAGGPKLFLASNPTGVSHYHMLRNYIEPDPDLVQRVVAYFPYQEAMEIWEKLKGKYAIDHQHPEEIRAASKEWIRLIKEAGLTWRQYDEHTARTKKQVEPYDIWTARPSEIMLKHGVTESHQRCFIPALLEDNPYVGPDYVTQLSERGEEIARAFLEGDWRVFEGQFFKEFAEKRYIEALEREVPWHVIDPIQPEPWWPKMCAMDWGFSNRSMLVVGWFAYNPEDEEWVMWQELAVNELTDSEVVRRWKSMTGDKQIDLVAADQAMFKDQNFENARSKGQIYREYGMPLEPAVNDRIQGWSALREFFSINPKTGRPKLRITSNCTYTIETLPGLMHDENKPEDLDTEGNDHAADMLRYFAVRAIGRENSYGYVPVSDVIEPGTYNPNRIAREEAQVVPAFLMGDEEDPFDEPTETHPVLKEAARRAVLRRGS